MLFKYRSGIIYSHLFAHVFNLIKAEYHYLYLIYKNLDFIVKLKE